MLHRFKRFTACCLMFLFAGSICTASAETLSHQDLIEKMIIYYGTFGNEADSQIQALLVELGAQDSTEAAKWAHIMELWHSVQRMPVTMDVLPDDLPQTDALCMVVLGFQLNPDGSMRDELLGRLNVAFASAQKYPNAYIVCTGGGTAEDAPATEAGEMAKWLIAIGIPAERVIVEDQSLTSAQNAKFTLQILADRYPQVTQLAVISSDYHIASGMLLFEAESILRATDPDSPPWSVVSHAAWHAPSGSLSALFQAGALIELVGDVDTAFDIYYETYDIHKLPPLTKTR